MTIFSYTGSPEVKISQKVLGGLLFLTHTVEVEAGMTIYGQVKSPIAQSSPLLVSIEGLYATSYLSTTQLNVLYVHVINISAATIGFY